MIKIRKMLKLGLLLPLLLALIYLLYLSTQQDYKVFSPTRHLGRPADKKKQEKDYMDFINEPPIQLPNPF